jgi:hypothetical protein
VAARIPRPPPPAGVLPPPALGAFAAPPPAGPAVANPPPQPSGPVPAAPFAALEPTLTEEPAGHPEPLEAPFATDDGEIPDWSPSRPSLDPPELSDPLALARAGSTHPASRTQALNSLFNLDAPTAALRAPVSADADTATATTRDESSTASGQDAKRSTMEFLYELDAPARSISREIDLEAEPELAAALAIAGARAPATSAASDSPADAGATPPPERLLPIELGVLLPTPDRPSTAEELHDQRRKRAILRIQTCRDSFRLLGFAGLPDAEHRGAARLFMELDEAIGRREGQPSAIKDPDTALAEPTKELLDTVERMIGPIEERLLVLDQMVSREAFQECVANSKVTKKLIVRYGRLLASRRFQSDERRNRFEWIATLLLTVTSPSGLRQPLPPEGARPVLQRLIGGLPYKAKEQELLEALDYLRESIARVRQLVSAEEFFESGFYVDAHGYKVTMRDQLLVPEFLYFSVVLNATVHNRLEAWISDLERLHNSNQLRQEGSAREQIMRGLRAQEEAVESALGVKRRPPVATARPEPATSDADESAPAKPKPKKKEKKAQARVEIAWDRNMITAVVSLVVILGVTGFLLNHTGVVGKPVVHAMTTGELQQVSPLLARGWIRGSGDERRLSASIFGHGWELLEARRRREEADRIASVLAAQGIKSAEITQGSTVVIRITDGYAAEVLGGKL